MQALGSAMESRSMSFKNKRKQGRRESRKVQGMDKIVEWQGVAEMQQSNKGVKQKVARGKIRAQGMAGCAGWQAERKRETDEEKGEKQAAIKAGRTGKEIGRVIESRSKEQWRLVWFEAAK